VSYWFYYKKADGPLQEIAVRDEADLPNAIQKYNDTDRPMTVLLQDGSSVVLQPGGRLSYSEGANRKRREVTLTGKAFFEIVKNKQKPFLVYSYGLATKVLGTSFTIDASSESKDIKVEVRTGTVSVFSINNLDHNQKEAALDKPELEGVTLNHDQRIAFSKESGKIVPLPAVVAVASDKDVSKQHFVFDETPVSEVSGYWKAPTTSGSFMTGKRWAVAR
jgi:transmembrane sensor